MADATWTVSPWLEHVEARAPELEDSLDVDVAVVGAGYTGLSAALALRSMGLSVAVLEAEVAGYGASGRNAGHLSPTIGKDPPSLVLAYGKATAKTLFELAEVAIGHAEALIERHRIDCDYERVGNVFAAVHPRQFGGVDRAATTAMELGVPGELLDRAGMEERGLPRTFLRGFHEPNGGILNPAKYVRGLRGAALDAGVFLFEKTPVVGFHPARTVVVRTPRGEVRARHVVVATNAYTSPLFTEGFDAAVPAIAKIHVQLYRTSPLTAEDLRAIAWRGRQGIYTAHEILESYRLTADQRIVGGSKHIRYGWDNSPLPDVDPTITASLERAFRARFPELAHVQVERSWGGPIGFALTFLPQVGRAGPHHNVFFSLGYAGHGVAQASYAGTMIADLLAGRDGPGSALWTRRNLGLPPEPWRWLVARCAMRLLEALDRRVDRAVTASSE